MIKTRSILTLLFFFLMATGCSHVISSKIRHATKKQLSFPMVLQNPVAHKGETVIFGGVIIEILNRQDGTVIKVLETPLAYNEMPADREKSRGRFILKTTKYLDPEIYQKGKKITVGGEITGQEVQALGEIQYTYPVIFAKEIYLWKETMRYYGRPYPVGFWDPWYFGPWYYPTYRHHHHHHHH